MHELSIAQSLISSVIQEKLDRGLGPIRSVGLKIGELSGVLPEALLFCFDLAREGTPLEETELKGNKLFVEINPNTAAEYRLSEGQRAMLETPKGKAEVLVHLFEGIMPGLVGIPKGLGYTGYDDYLAGKGVNANSLMGVVEDPITGLSATWGIRAKLTSV